MKTNCNLNAKIGNSNSQLFSDLTSEFGYENAKKVYGYIHTPEFIERFGNWVEKPNSIKNKLNYQGEPSIQDVAKSLGLTLKKFKEKKLGVDIVLDNKKKPLDNKIEFDPIQFSIVSEDDFQDFYEPSYNDPKNDVKNDTSLSPLIRSDIYNKLKAKSQVIKKRSMMSSEELKSYVSEKSKAKKITLNQTITEMDTIDKLISRLKHQYGVETTRLEKVKILKLINKLNLKKDISIVADHIYSELEEFINNDYIDIVSYLNYDKSDNPNLTLEKLSELFIKYDKFGFYAGALSEYLSNNKFEDSEDSKQLQKYLSYLLSELNEYRKKLRLLGEKENVKRLKQIANSTNFTDIVENQFDLKNNNLKAISEISTIEATTLDVTRSQDALNAFIGYLGLSEESKISNDAKDSLQPILDIVKSLEAKGLDVEKAFIDITDDDGNYVNEYSENTLFGTRRKDFQIISNSMKTKIELLKLETTEFDKYENPIIELDINGEEESNLLKAYSQRELILGDDLEDVIFFKDYIVKALKTKGFNVAFDIGNSKLTLNITKDNFSKKYEFKLDSKYNGYYKFLTKGQYKANKYNNIGNVFIYQFVNDNNLDTKDYLYYIEQSLYLNPSNVKFKLKDEYVSKKYKSILENENLSKLYNEIIKLSSNNYSDMKMSFLNNDEFHYVFEVEKGHFENLEVNAINIAKVAGLKSYEAMSEVFSGSNLSSHFDDYDPFIGKRMYRVKSQSQRNKTFENKSRNLLQVLTMQTIAAKSYKSRAKLEGLFGFALEAQKEREFLKDKDTSKISNSNNYRQLEHFVNTWLYHSSNESKEGKLKFQNTMRRFKLTESEQFELDRLETQISEMKNQVNEIEKLNNNINSLILNKDYAKLEELFATLESKMYEEKIMIIKTLYDNSDNLPLYLLLDEEKKLNEITNHFSSLVKSFSNYDFENLDKYDSDELKYLDLYARDVLEFFQNELKLKLAAIKDLESKTTTIGKFADYHKVLEGINEHTRSSVLAFNLKSAVMDIVNGLSMMSIETASNSDFENSNTVSSYMSALNPFSSEHDKVKYLAERLNISNRLLDFRYGSTHIGPKSTAENWTDPNKRYLLQSITSNINTLAITKHVLDSYMVTDPNDPLSKVTLGSLYDKNGKYIGSGIDPLSDSETKIKIGLMIQEYIFRIYGNFDGSRSVLMDKSIYGKLLKTFRSWMFNTLETFLGSERPDFIRGKKAKGRLTSMINAIITGNKLQFLKGMVLGFSGTTKYASKLGADLKDIDIENAGKLGAWIRNMIISAMIGKVLYELLSEDDEDEPLLIFAINIADRNTSDLIFYGNPFDWAKVINERPFPVITTIVSTINKIQALSNLMTEEGRKKDVYKSGIKKGESKALNSILSSVWFYNGLNKTIMESKKVNSEDKSERKERYKELGISTSKVKNEDYE